MMLVKRIESVVPDVAADVVAGYDPVAMEDQEFQERILLRGQVDRASGAGDDVAGGIQGEVGDVQDRGPGRDGAAGEGPQAREQLLEVERLDQVVVSARVEPGDSVVHGVACGQHQDGRAEVIGAQFAADREAVPRREHHVEDDEVVVVDGRLVEGPVGSRAISTA